ncbi:MAG: HD-GYP domain-containing protein [Nitrospirae bacterium]|nr:HD-GYP domain-containing protein [Nitrospirota bacterium]
MTSGIFEEKKGSAAKDFTNNLYKLIRTAQIHDSINVATIAVLKKTMESIKILLDRGGQFSLRLYQESLFIDDEKIRVDIENFLACTTLMNEMKKLSVGSISFSHQSTIDELCRFIYAFNSVEYKSADPFKELEHKLTAQGINNITVDRIENGDVEDGIHIIQDSKEVATNLYFKTLSAVSDVMDSAKLKNAVGIKKTKRMIQSMVDLIVREEATVLGLTTLRSYDEYTYNHSVNVSILSIAIGQRLGYDRKALSDLGMATLFHDIGKIDLPLEVLNKPSEFTPEEWKIMRTHPINGVKTLLRLKGLQEQAIRMILSSFEHHLNYDLSGYPKLASARRVSLFGRITSICDCYDALTSARVYNRSPLVPDKALSYMMKKSSIAFDPLLLKIFVNVIGIYPIGTIVLLNTQELAVVVRANANPVNIHKPCIKIITDSHGNETDGETIDLSWESKTAIVQSVDHRKYGIEVSKYFIS